MTDPASVRLNNLVQTPPALLPLEHGVDPVPDRPSHDQRWKGWYKLTNSPKIYGQEQTSKAAARESAAEEMIAYITGS